ncbi:MAG: histidine kinase [Actinomycetaceae bacterium]|nr:histidine kinase [Actinomycetaceae bacterium]MDY6083452.1 histidine kinase [Actinomycetaceae bacterium]
MTFRRISRLLHRRTQHDDAAAQIHRLRASRREIVAAFEIERRRIERDLHDGAQQYLVRANMAVGEAQLILDRATQNGTKLPEGLDALPQILENAQTAGEKGLRVLRETVNNIHPKVLSDIGLEAAVRDAAASSSLDIRLVVPHQLPDMPEGVIAAAYFVVTEALTNVAKYAPDAHTSILLSTDENLHVSVVDEGPGGARITPGHGLAGLRERLAAFGGSLRLDSPPGGPTTVSASVPLLLFEGESAITISDTDRDHFGMTT